MPGLDVDNLVYALFGEESFVGSSGALGLRVGGSDMLDSTLHLKALAKSNLHLGRLLARFSRRFIWPFL